MKTKLRLWLIIVAVGVSSAAFAQDVALYTQFSGHYDFVFIGNTLNSVENNSIPGQPSPPCAILNSSSAALNLGSGNTIQSAYLYWAGSGTGDFNVKLNAQEVTAQRTFSLFNPRGLACFAAFTDVTAQVLATGNGLYTLSELDLSAIIDPYCPSGGNFGGWAIVIVYENPSLPLNQLNVYDGLEGVPNTINILLDNLNVIDNVGAKIGFLAWEGDKNIAVSETLSINGNVLQSALNPPNNAFNGTNSFTGSDTLYNMDLDVYDIQDNINIGDTSANIQLTSGQDFVMINCIVTKLNSQLPDATIATNQVNVACNSRQVSVGYTVYNVNATNVLQGGVPIAIYANGNLIAQTQTLAPIAINGSESGSISLMIPDGIPDSFDLTFVVDDNGTGQGVVIESNEANNKAGVAVTLGTAAPLPTLQPLWSCNKGLGKGLFDFSAYKNRLQTDVPGAVILFYASMADLQTGQNAITDLQNYNAPDTPMGIFVKVDNGSCYDVTSFELRTRKCPPIVYNFVSANGDAYNNSFFIEGLRDVFTHFGLSIYNRWGHKVWTGDNNSPDWDGSANQGLRISPAYVSDGTYFYVLELNDPDYPEPLTGFVYLTRS